MKKAEILRLGFLSILRFTKLLKSSSVSEIRLSRITDLFLKFCFFIA